MTMIMYGKLLRKLRKRFGYSLQELSDKTHLSVGYLSNIERDFTSPTVNTLDIICTALRVDITDVLSAARRPSPLLRREERPVVYRDKDGLLENIVAENNSFRMTSYTMSEDNDKYVVVSEGDPSLIIGYQQTGSSEFLIDSEVYNLQASDTITIPPNTPYRFRRTSPEENIILWVYERGNRI